MRLKLITSALLGSLLLIGCGSDATITKTINLANGIYDGYATNSQGVGVYLRAYSGGGSVYLAEENITGESNALYVGSQNVDNEIIFGSYKCTTNGASLACNGYTLDLTQTVSASTSTLTGNYVFLDGLNGEWSATIDNSGKVSAKRINSSNNCSLTGSVSASGQYYIINTAISGCSGEIGKNGNFSGIAEMETMNKDGDTINVALSGYEYLTTFWHKQ